MSFKIPNQADAGNAKQAEVDKVDLDILVAALAGDGLISGCAVTSNSNMAPSVAAGVVKVGTTQVAVTGGTVTVTTADATNPRFDLVVVNNSGTKSVTAGTPAATPVFPAIPANSVVLAAIYVGATVTTIETANITDKRCVVVTGPMPFTWWTSTNLGTGTNDTNFFLLSGAGPQGTDTKAVGTRQLCPKPGTAKLCFAAVTTAPAGAATRTFKLYINGVASALAAVISGAAVAGNDSTTLVAVAAGDELSMTVINNATAPAQSDGAIVTVVVE